MKPLLVSSGEPAGIGPDLCLELAGSDLPLVVLGDKSVLGQRAKALGRDITLIDYQSNISPVPLANHLVVLHIPCPQAVIPGKLNPNNSSYVLDILATGFDRCLSGEFSALVTAPVHKAVINEAGYSFTGHTEFFAERCQVNQVVMMLTCPEMKVALVTTHLPLKDVAKTITESSIIDVITILNNSLRQDFGIGHPVLYVSGLNPHAGEGGYLGNEEIEVISPALAKLKQQGIIVHGPMPADTMFTPQNAKACDAFVAMYHDQGLSVLKYAGFGQAVNITLGLPIIRTSVDHGTALDLAGSGQTQASSLLAAVEMAANLVQIRESAHEHH